MRRCHAPSPPDFADFVVGGSGTFIWATMVAFSSLSMPTMRIDRVFGGSSSSGSSSSRPSRSSGFSDQVPSSLPDPREKRADRGNCTTRMNSLWFWP